MTTKIIAKEEIRAHVLKVLSGYSFRERKLHSPKITILSPWISDVQLEIDKGVFELDTLWFGLDYGIASINLSYALLLLRLDFGAEIEIVTLPPTQENYGDGAYYRQRLLEFLDEIGCQVYIHSELHSKLILSNDSALLGSFNLSKSALYNREEIGVSIDDIGNLKILEKYVKGVVQSSIPYGISPKLTQFSSRFETLSDQLTRGKLFEMIIRHHYGRFQVDSDEYGNFIRDQIGLKGIYSKYIIQEIASDLEEFYTKALLTVIKPSTRYYDPDRDYGLRKFRELVNFQGEFNSENLVQFMKRQYGRTQIPKIKLKLETMPRAKGENTPK